VAGIGRPQKRVSKRLTDTPIFICIVHPGTRHL